jgi:hypothetical protein
LAGVTIAVLVIVVGTVSASAASQAAGPATAGSTTVVFTLHFSPFDALHLNPKPGPKTRHDKATECLFRAALTATSNDRDYRQIESGYVRASTMDSSHTK